MLQIKTELTPEQYALLYAAVTAMQALNRGAYNLAIMEGLFEIKDGIITAAKELDGLKQKLFGPAPTFAGTLNFSEYGQFLEYFLNATPAARLLLVNEP